MPAEFLTDGHPTLITLSTPGDGPANVHFKEVATQPPGMQGGGENDTSTMRNTTWRTRQPKSLITLSEMSLTVQYSPEVYNVIVAIVNVNQEITVTFSDGSQVKFWGWLDEFVPNEAVEGEMPTAEITIIPSNQDDSGVEQAPVLTTPA